MQKLHKVLASYGAYHQKKSTRMTHYFGIPIVMLSIFILFAWVQVSVANAFSLSLSSLLITGVALYYFSLNYRLALITLSWILPLNLVAYYLAGNAPNATGFYWFLGSFVVGWALQLIGHVFEGRRPALVDNFGQTLAAPLFITAEILVSLGKSDEFKEMV